jgi:hypothetical protein
VKSQILQDLGIPAGQKDKMQVSMQAEIEIAKNLFNDYVLKFHNSTQLHDASGKTSEVLQHMMQYYSLAKSNRDVFLLEYLKGKTTKLVYIPLHGNSYGSFESVVAKIKKDISALSPTLRDSYKSELENVTNAEEASLLSLSILQDLESAQLDFLSQINDNTSCMDVT